MRIRFNLAILGFLLVTVGRLSAQIDGLYWVSEEPTKLRMTASSGQKVYIGQYFTEKIDEADLVSITNDNSKFQFFLHQHKDYIACPEIAFISRGLCLVIDGRGGGKDETVRNTVVSDPTDIDRIAAFFKIQPRKRSNPGHRLEVKLVVKKPIYEASEPVPIDFQVTNCGTKTITLEQPLTIETRDGNLLFQGTREMAYGEKVKVESVPGTSVGAGPVLLVSNPAPHFDGNLQPGETLWATVNLKDFLILDKPGSYTIRGTCKVVVVPEGVDTGDKWGFVRTDLEWDDSPSAEGVIKINGPAN